MNKENKKSNNLFVIILFLVIIIFALFFPKIYNFIEKEKLPDVPKVENNDNTQDKEVKEEDLADIHFPIMRNSIYDADTYYSLDEFTIDDMSNSDILYNAFMGIEETGANIKSSNYNSKCSNTKVEFNSFLIDNRAKSILNRNIKYNLESFYVPEDSSSSYKGTWQYDSSNSRFVYDGVCDKKTYNTKYYDLEDFIKAEYDGKDIVVYYYLGFAKVENNNYTIYSDANMTKEIYSGTSTDINEIKSTFKSLGNKDKKIYKYTFKDTLCKYYEYCLYKGEYVDEL